MKLSIIFPHNLLVIVSLINTLLCFSPVFVTSTDTLTTSDSLNINQTLTSAGRKFELGFFTKGKIHKKYYVGIKYKDIPSDVIVWVANRDAPSWDDASIFKLGNFSNLVILDGGSHIIWQTNKSNGINPVMQLLDTGNLVIREAGNSNPENFIWQSFNHPADTLLPGQKLGWNLTTGLNRFLTSWRSMDDPDTGNFTVKLDYRGDPEIYLRMGDHIIYRSGPWVGPCFNGIPQMGSDYAGDSTFTNAPGEVYYTFNFPAGEGVKSRLMVTSDGMLVSLTWSLKANQWSTFWQVRANQCDEYQICGPYGFCNISAPGACKCPQGFKPQNPVAWEIRDWSDGCVRETRLDCHTDDFMALHAMKLPDTTSALVRTVESDEQCSDMCTRNCNCMAYANKDSVELGWVCVIWTDDLIDLKVEPLGGQNLYVRTAASHTGSAALTLPGFSPNGSHKASVKMVVGIAVTATAILVGVSVLIIRKHHKSRARRRSDVLKKKGKKRSREDNDGAGDKNSTNLKEIPLFTFESLAAATSNFHDHNKLGRGGFGSVYKGILENGHEIAVKRLSRASRQGTEEFMNEVKLISKLQHRNLVRLLGCSVEGDEKMLIYEYMPNKSLDAYLFGKDKELEWEKRYKIIEGICRGLQYMHRDSRLKIIHRDLKASNILLDKDFNPKISDFGMARIFGDKDDEIETRRIVGTYGYMPPEYAMHGLFSEKSDVFSFGVLILEIISGERNRVFTDNEKSFSLLGFAWKLLNEKNLSSLIDPEISLPYHEKDIFRCVQVGLLCVQEFAQDRPSISNVISMLNGEISDLPYPNKPGFDRISKEDNYSSESHRDSTANSVSITTISGR